MKRFLVLLLLVLILFSCKKNSEDIGLENLAPALVTSNKENVEVIEANYYKVTIDLLRARTEPKSGSSIATVLNKGDVVNVTKYRYNDDYSEIIYGGEKLYVATMYIIKESDYVNDETYENITETKIDTTTDKEIENNEVVNDDKKEEVILTAENYPRVDGSTANMPLMAMIRSDVLNEDLTISQNKTKVSTTDYAWRNLLYGDTDLLLVYEASSETKEIIENSDTKLKITPIGVDALVFIENDKNKIDNLTTEQLQKIYTGEIDNWKQLGGEDKKIQAFQRPLNSGSQTLFLNLVMKGKTPKEALKYEKPAEMDGLIDVLATYNDSQNAIGYSVFYYAKKMYQVPGLKLISVDGVMPSDESIGSGKYPFLNKYYVAIREDTDINSPTRKLYDYIISDKGKEAIIRAGYIPYVE